MNKINNQGLDEIAAYYHCDPEEICLGDYLACKMVTEKQVCPYVVIFGSADFSDSQITDLGKLQSIGGNVDFSNSKITDLGQLQSIGRYANFRNSQITDLGQLQSIGGIVGFNTLGQEEIYKTEFKDENRISNIRRRKRF